MKLNQIKTVNEGYVNLNEGVIPVHLTMTLGQVVRDGKISNNVQKFIMAGLIEMFKNGGPHRWPRDLNAYEMATSSDLIEAVCQLEDSEAVAISEWLMSCLASTSTYENNPYAKPQMNVVDWVRYVLKKQD